MDVKKQFEITEKAGTFVAGQRNPGACEKLWLTEEQAFYPLIAGEIVRPEKVEKPAPAPKAKSATPKAEKES